MFELLKDYFNGFDFPKYLETGDMEMNEGGEIFKNFLEEKGREKERKETVLKMLQKGYPIEDIEDITGLSEDKINELQSSLTAAA